MLRVLSKKNLISQPKHMLLVPIRTVSLRGFFEHPKYMLNMMGKNIFTIVRWKTVFNLNLCLTIQHLSMPPLKGWETYDLAHEILVTLSNNEGSDEPAQILRLAKAFAACIHIFAKALAACIHI